MPSCVGTAAHWAAAAALHFNSRRFKESRQILLSCSPPLLFPCNHLSERIGSLQQPFWNISFACNPNFLVSFVALFGAGSGVDLELEVMDYWSVAFLALLTLTGPLNPSLIFFKFIYDHFIPQTFHKQVNPVDHSKQRCKRRGKKDPMGQRSNMSECSEGGGGAETSRSRQEAERC